ncbi:hypothetical protein V4V35_05720 [Bacillus infantis]|uniref:hypothetical protein n=1 Tax=Bacillus infantis TaxID=324767 RepID=UPI002FBD8C95
MKRKWVIICVVLISIVLLGIFIYFNQLRYPPLPADVESLTPREVVQKLNESDQPLVQISKDNEATWYIMKNEDVNEQIKQFISSKGWIFKEKDGNSLFFEKEDDVLIVGTEIWTSNYRFVKVPARF